MINFKSESELKNILNNFEAPELVFIGREDAGPDEELYFYKDGEGNTFVLWSRDHMSELEYEANGLKNDFNITIVKWLELRNVDVNDDYEEKRRFYFTGDWYALGLVG